jgi:putative transposase
MLKAYKYRLYPTLAQQELIRKHIGSCRFVYNLALETRQTAYAGNKINLNYFALQNQLPDLKKECPWLKEVCAQSLQVAIRNLDNAFTLFFKGHSNFPKFKSKYKGSQSFNVPQKVIVVDDKLFIPKFREGIKIILSRSLPGKIKNATISRTFTGKYFVSILCDTGQTISSKPIIEEKTSIGIDLGIKSYLITSDGEVLDNPKYLKKSEAKLKYIQRKYSKYKGKKTKQKLILLHEKIANQRKDFLHKTSSKLISENQTICTEDLNISGMLKNHSLAKSIFDAGWGEFVKQLEYKAEWYGKNILKIGRFDPSSKTCSSCGYINRDLKLSDREWTCPKCSSVLDRDVNAAVNIKSFALKNHLSTVRRFKNQNELPTLVGVLTSEV